MATMHPALLACVLLLCAASAHAKAFHRDKLHGMLAISAAAPFGSADTSSSNVAAELSVGLMTVDACAVFAEIHAHPFADELCTVLSGTFSLGLILDASSSFVPPLNTSNPSLLERTNQTSGDFMIFPRGLMHYQVNTGCTTGTMFFSWNSANAGLLLLPATVSSLPPYLATTEFNQSSIPSVGLFARDPECVARCGLA